MVKPLPIFLCAVVTCVTVVVAGCCSRNDDSANVNADGGKERSRGAPKSGMPHAMATPVAALGVRG